MTEETPDLGPGADITAADLDVEEPVDPPATSDPAEMVDGDDALGGTGGGNAGGAG
jgi:hypothetical protein